MHQNGKTQSASTKRPNSALTYYKHCTYSASINICIWALISRMHLQMHAIGPSYDGFVPLCNASQVPTKGGWFLKDSIPLKKKRAMCMFYQSQSEWFPAHPTKYGLQASWGIARMQWLCCKWTTAPLACVVVDLGRHPLASRDSGICPHVLQDQPTPSH